jgi:hypothetical protein
MEPNSLNTNADFVVLVQFGSVGTLFNYTPFKVEQFIIVIHAIAEISLK